MNREKILKNLKILFKSYYYIFILRASNKIEDNNFLQLRKQYFMIPGVTETIWKCFDKYEAKLCPLIIKLTD